MNRTTAINQFLTSFDQSQQTTAEQIIAVGRFYDLAYADGIVKGANTYSQVVSNLQDRMAKPVSA